MVTFPPDNINDRSSSGNSSNPLVALETDGYSVSNFTYPIDLTADPGENHMVVFYINESSQTQFTTISGNIGQNGILSSGTPTGTSRYNNSQGLFSNIPSNNNPTISDTQNNVTTFTNTPINRVSTCIALYIPPVVSTTYQTDWGTMAFGATGGAIKGAFGGDIVRSLGESSVGIVSQLLESAKDAAKNKANIDFDLEAAISVGTHLVRNPNLEMLFRGIGFRQYQFDFKFTPRSEQESLNVANIIKAFKFYASPEVRVAINTPRYYIWPAEFDIEFWSNGRLNNFINRISTCACTEVTVNYTGSGAWSAFRPNATNELNGVGVETNLTIKLQELEIITKNRVLMGF